MFSFYCLFQFCVFLNRCGQLSAILLFSSPSWPWFWLTMLWGSPPQNYRFLMSLKWVVLQYYSTVSFSFVDFHINLSSVYEYVIDHMTSHSQPEMTVAGSSAQWDQTHGGPLLWPSSQLCCAPSSSSWTNKSLPLLLTGRNISWRFVTNSQYAPFG